MTEQREQATTETPARKAARSSRPWWRRPPIVPLLVLVAAFLAFSLPPYLTFDPATSRALLREGFPLHYPFLVSHILFGTIALVTCCLQIWPWLRQRSPATHRRLGRLYVFAGVIPSGVLALVVAPAAVQGVSGRIGNTLLAVVWLVTTITAWRMARQRRYAEHRRWMIRSFALTTSIVLNRVWLILLFMALSPYTSTYFRGDEAAMIQAVAESSIWLSWVVNLLIAEWWLERGRRRPARKGAGQRRAEPA